MIHFDLVKPARREIIGAPLPRRFIHMMLVNGKINIHYLSRIIFPVKIHSHIIPAVIAFILCALYAVTERAYILHIFIRDPDLYPGQRALTLVIQHLPRNMVGHIQRTVRCRFYLYLIIFNLIKCI